MFSIRIFSFAMQVLEIHITELFGIKSYLYALVTNRLVFGLNFKLTSTCFSVQPPPNMCGECSAVTWFSLCCVVTEQSIQLKYMIGSKSPISVQGWFVHYVSVTNLSSIFSWCFSVWHSYYTDNRVVLRNHCRVIPSHVQSVLIYRPFFSIFSCVLLLCNKHSCMFHRNTVLTFFSRALNFIIHVYSPAVSFSIRFCMNINTTSFSLSFIYYFFILSYFFKLQIPFNPTIILREVWNLVPRQIWPSGKKYSQNQRIQISKSFIC